MYPLICMHCGQSEQLVLVCPGLYWFGGSKVSHLGNPSVLGKMCLLSSGELHEDIPIS